jgi:hypothetical protein
VGTAIDRDFDKEKTTCLVQTGLNIPYMIVGTDIESNLVKKKTYFLVKTGLNTLTLLW